MWDFSTSEAFTVKLTWARDLVDNAVLPLEVLDLDWAGYRAAIAPLQAPVKQRDLWGAYLPPKLGGPGLSQVEVGLLNEVIGRSWWASPVFGHHPPDSGNVEILAMNGTSEQKERWLRPLYQGEIYSCMAMTEVGAGADPTLLSTRMVPDRDGFVLSGGKWFATCAGVADIIFVMVVTDPEASPHERASIIVLEAGTPGVEILRPIPTIISADGHFPPFDHHYELRFTDVRVPRSALLGNVGEGFRIMQQRLGPGRIHHAMRWIGQAQRALEMLCERATYRRVQGGRLADKQTIRAWIADSAAELQALRLMTLQAAWVIDTQGMLAARKQVAMIKYYGAKVLHDVIDRAVQAHGSLGLSADLPLELMYRYARAARVYDGPDEVHRETVAKLILRDYRPPAGEIPTEHVPTRRAAALSRLNASLEPQP